MSYQQLLITSESANIGLLQISVFNLIKKQPRSDLIMNVLIPPTPFTAEAKKGVNITGY